MSETIRFPDDEPVPKIDDSEPCAMTFSMGIEPDLEDEDEDDEDDERAPE